MYKITQNSIIMSKIKANAIMIYEQDPVNPDRYKHNPTKFTLASFYL